MQSVPPGNPESMITPESSYLGRHAKLYDLFYAEKPYLQETAFVDSLIQLYRPGAVHLLELACGTGSHSLLLERCGYRIVATDYSPDMLACARQKAREQNSGVDFRHQDMRELNIPEHSFDVVICLFDSIGYVASNTGVLAVLQNVNRHLAQDGLFVFEFWHAGAMIRGYDPLRIRRFKTPQGEVQRISETHIDFREQLCHVSYTIHEFELNGVFHTLRETQVNRFFLLQEMNFFLQQAHFIPLRWFSGFQEDENIDENTWHIVAVARKERDI